MSELLLNGAPVLRATIEAFREGAWVADLDLDTDAVPEGVVDVTDGSGTVLLRGRVLRAEAPYARAEVRLAGGSGRLGATLPPRYYRAAPVLTVLRDLASESGSTLSPLIDPVVLGTPLAAWVRLGGEDVVTGLRHLLRSALPAGWVWRTRLDGSLWLGADAWPEVIAPGVEVVRRSPARGELELRAVSVAELLAIEPGSIFEGLDVASVRIDATPTGLRAIVRTHAAARTLGDPITGGIHRMAREATVERALFGMYEAVVVLQDSDGRVHLQPQPDIDEARRTIPMMTKVPLIGPYPGGKVLFATASIQARSVRVLLGFAGGDPSRPYAVPWGLPGSVPSRVEIDAATTIALGGDAKGVAREADPVGAGTVTGSTPSGPVTFTHVPEGGGAPVVSTTLTIVGKITGASSKVRAS